MTDNNSPDAQRVWSWPTAEPTIEAVRARIQMPPAAFDDAHEPVSEPDWMEEYAERHREGRTEALQLRIGGDHLPRTTDGQPIALSQRLSIEMAENVESSVHGREYAPVYAREVNTEDICGYAQAPTSGVPGSGLTLAQVRRWRDTGSDQPDMEDQIELGREGSSAADKDPRLPGYDQRYAALRGIVDDSGINVQTSKSVTWPLVESDGDIVTMPAAGGEGTMTEALTKVHGAALGLITKFEIRGAEAPLTDQLQSVAAQWVANSAAAAAGVGNFPPRYLNEFRDQTANEMREPQAFLNTLKAADRAEAQLLRQTQPARELAKIPEHMPSEHAHTPEASLDWLGAGKTADPPTPPHRPTTPQPTGSPSAELTIDQKPTR